MNVISLFDGISCGRLALKRAGIEVDNYYASEIDPYAIKISQKNFPDVYHLGDVTKWRSWVKKPKIDLLLAGSPCQGFSRAGLERNFDDPRSKLFFEFINILNWYEPTYFLLENVVMRHEYQDVITDYLGVEPIMIDSALVSAQSRKRLYWTNIPNVTQPEDRNILLKDIVFSDVEPIAVHNIYGGFKEETARIFTDKSPTIRTSAGGGHIPSLLLSKEGLAYMDRKIADGRTHWDFAHHSDIANPKSATVVANFFKGVPYNVFRDEHCIRKFDPIECERLQTLPDNYTAGGMIWYNGEEIKSFLGRNIWQKNVQLRDVNVYRKCPWDIVCYITNDGNDMGVPNYSPNPSLFVNIVMQKLSPKECVEIITTITTEGETHNIPISLESSTEIKLLHMDTFGIIMGNIGTSELWKITWEENYSQEKLSTILIWIKQIIGLKIFYYAHPEEIMHISINNLWNYARNCCELILSNLKVGRISKISNTQRYKMIGNGWTVDVISHILKGLR